MEYTPVTPFRRIVDAGVMKHQAVSEQELPPQGANKWEVLRELSTARLVFGLTDRDLGVLQALLSFHPATVLGGNDEDLIVYPSNASICERLNGMPCSTMRRHLSHLVQAGFLVRRDSPNGKRYARRHGGETVAFGFDLSPLVLRFGEICQAAEATRESAERHKRLRETVSLMRRDLAGLAAYGADLRPDLPLWDQFADLAALTARDLRRKLDIDALQALQTTLKQALDNAREILEPTGDNASETKIPSTNASHSEQHYQNSNTNSYDLEPCLEKAKAAASASEPQPPAPVESDAEPDSNLPTIPLGLVLPACQEYRSYIPDPIRHWHDLVRVAHEIRPMMGISPTAWDEAKTAMGPEQAAVVLVALLERFEEIRSPGGYLRSLTQKAAEGAFSCAPMVMAQLRRVA